MNLFNGMFGKVANGMCRLSMSGGIAVKTKNGYKTYNLKKKRLTNCDNFVFNIGEEFFFVIPTNKVQPGDIILKDGSPRCVVSVNADEIRAINYEDSVLETIIPERHVFMGKTYFYGKIVSMFGSDFKGSNKGMGKMMSYMMMSEMMKGSGSAGMGSASGMSAMLPFMMLSGGNGFADMFDGMFDFDFGGADVADDDDDDDEDEAVPVRSK